MTLLDAKNMEYTALNQVIRQEPGDYRIINCLGQRFIGAGLSQREITVEGIPGNALGAYLNGARITVHGNAQDAVGDTMNEGQIIIHGNVGDAVGYAMRGGRIFVKGNAGYRAGIHMKAYREKNPVMVIGGRTGSFLGEYQAGGTIVVLGLHTDGKPIVSNFPGAGMHGGKMFLRSDCQGIRFPRQVSIHRADEDELEQIRPILREYCGCFGVDYPVLMDAPFTVVVPDSSNPYRQMYVSN
ncbi:MAG: glutamate synthase [Faecousia sp.]